jgi:hypothetical protein
MINICFDKILSLTRLNFKITHRRRIGSAVATHSGLQRQRKATEAAESRILSDPQLNT